MKFKDIIISDTIIKFGLIDRIRILCGKSCHIKIMTETEYIPGHVQSTNHIFVENILPTKRIMNQPCEEEKETKHATKKPT